MKIKQPQETAMYKYDSGFEDHPIHEIETNTINDLINFFSKFPKNMPVIMIWEGQTNSIYNAFLGKDINENLVLFCNVDPADVEDDWGEDIELK